jgi:hypothetical protein
MSWEVATFLVAAASVVVTVVYGEIQRQRQKQDHELAEEQLRLAKEEAELRPELTVTLGEPPLTYLPVENLPSAGYDATLLLTIINTGGTTAHNVNGGLWLKDPHLEAEGYGHASFTDQFFGNLAPTLSYGLSARVRVRSYGMTKVRYRCWADEVPLTEGAFEFEVAKRHS